MSLQTDVLSEIGKIFQRSWTTREGNVVPESEDIALGNDAVTLNGTVFYADLRESTTMVDTNPPSFAAEVYKAYLLCAARIVRDEGGIITAYDGDRLMAVFLGNSKNTSAVRSSLKLNYAVDEIINPSLKRQYSSATFRVQHVVGVDTSPLFVARTGIRGSNDLVWVGRAANHAAKLTSLKGFAAWISSDVFQAMHGSVKISSKGESMWKLHTSTDMNKRTIYASSWRWGSI